MSTERQSPEDSTPETAHPPLPEEPPQNAARDRKSNRRTVLFMSVFAISVFFFLTGYRFLIGTLANDWYLYCVAGNTATALNWIGESATLEGLPGILSLPPNQPRAALAAWDRGDEAPTPEEIAAASKEPLSTWEQYRYRIEKSRHERPGASLGPRVNFVLRGGTATALQAAEEELRQAAARGDATDPAKKAELDALRAKVDEYRKVMRDAAKSPDKNVETSYQFAFHVVSECGAIEVMAIFFSAVIAFPTLWKKRLIGLVCGLPLMYLLNIFRLTLLAIIGAVDRGGQWFKFTHEYLWQAVYIVFVVVVWMIWIEFVVRGRKR